jgi:hypothetical protein
MWYIEIGYKQQQPFSIFGTNDPNEMFSHQEEISKPLEIFAHTEADRQRSVKVPRRVERIYEGRGR